VEPFEQRNQVDMPLYLFHCSDGSKEKRAEQEEEECEAEEVMKGKKRRKKRRARKVIKRS
jgi:hypothetical protein